MTVSFSLSIAEMYDGFIDYWSGHGPAFVDKHVVACIVLQCPIDYRETNADLVASLDDDTGDWYYLADLSDQEKEQINKLDIRAFLASEFKPAKESAFAFNDAFDESDEESDSPQFVCVLHVWREVSDRQ